MPPKVPLNNLFFIKHGVELGLNRLEKCSYNEPSAVNFVSRTDKNNGVVAVVKSIKGIEPNPANTISVACGGSVLAAFLQPKPYYSAWHVFYLTPKRAMSEIELLYYCFCIRQNRYLYNFGRQANKTLGKILVPSEIPHEFENIDIKRYDISNQALVDRTAKLDTGKWMAFKYDQLFIIQTGVGPSKKPAKVGNGSVPHISTTERNNGVSYYLDLSTPPHERNCITVSNDGSIGEAFYQPRPFCASYKVNVLNPKFKLTPYIAFFLLPLIRMEKYRYSYGRKWGIERMKKTIIKLPVTPSGEPDWVFMENYIKSLPYSSELEKHQP